MTGHVVEASPGRPYLSLRLPLDPAVITKVVMDLGTLSTHQEESREGDRRAPLGDGLLDATLRLVRLVEKPYEYQALAPFVVREIAYRLLTGSQRARMHHLATFAGHAHRMVRAVEKRRSNFDKPLRMEAMAREMGLSLSAFDFPLRR